VTIAPADDPHRVEDLLDQLEHVNEALERTNRDLTAALRALEEKDRRHREDLAQARAFQQQILPREPQPGFFDCRAVYRPVEMVGGDIYDIAELDAWAFRFFIADAPGHGVQAAMRTMIVKTEYDRIKETSMDPAQLLELNDRICALARHRAAFRVLPRPPAGEGARAISLRERTHWPSLAPRAAAGRGRALSVTAASSA
jgi:serine phosphatase RsbU (regulator of sigma subunit)